MGSFTGKTAFITAAAQGIGRASVEAFAKAGARVIATDIDAGKLADLAGGNVEDLSPRRFQFGGGRGPDRRVGPHRRALQLCRRRP